MTTAATEKTGTGAVTGTTAPPRGELRRRRETALADGGEGSTKIADVVVQKIAGLAAREVPGVRALGGGTSRTIGALRNRIPGAGTSHGQGVTVEVGERQAAVDLDMLVEYGVSIPVLARTVRQNVISSIEEMTGLEVVEVNITVADVYVDGDSAGDAELSQRARVE
jgi:uncharacterized alkaline shock family protein YloU